MASINHKRKEKQYMMCVSEIVNNELTNVNISNTTVTNVKLSSDGSHLKVLVVFSEKEERSLENLKNTESFVRKCLSRIKNQRTAPKVIFEIDTAYKSALKIEEILKKIK